MSGTRLGKRRERVAVQPVSLPEAGPEDIKDTRIERALSSLADTINALIGQSVYEADVNLTVGTNTISHGLNRQPVNVQVMPKVAAAGFAWGWDPAQPSNPKPTLLIQITSATAATARIRVE